MLRKLGTLLFLLVAIALPQRLAAVEPLVVSGYDFSAYLAADGTVWTWGSNTYGQLGDGTTTPRSVPQQVPGLNQVIGISTGYYHVLAVLSDGSVRAWGQNTNGQLGIGNQTNQYSPVNPGLSDIKAVAGGGYFSLALTAAGSALAWGQNSNGQLGDNSTTTRTTPVAVFGSGRYRAIAGGGSHSLAITWTGTMQAWGNNGEGQVGDGTFVNKLIPTTVTGISNALSIAAGWNHSVAGIADGSLRTWGWNNAGQLGNGTTVNSSTPVQPSAIAVTRVFAGYQHSGYLRIDSQINLWGSNSHGQCLQPISTTQVLTPTIVYRTVNFRCTGTGIGNHTLYVGDDGTVRGWGNNQSGQLGNGTSGSNQLSEVTTTTKWSLDAISAIDAGRGHSIALKADGTVWTWGSDANGELGDDALQQNKSTPVQVQGLSGVYAISAGSYHNLALTCVGTMYAWGQNGNGQVGDNGGGVSRFTPVPVIGGSYFRAIGAGGYHSLAILWDGSLSTWGANGNGQLGDGGVINQPTPAALPIATVNNMVEVDGGWQHSIARAGNGIAYTWGYGGYGQIGNGGVANQLTPLAIIGGITSIAAGEVHCSVLRGDGSMYAWGGDSYGQLADSVAFTDQVSLTFVSSTPSRKRVSVGGDYGRHTVILQGNGTVVTAGSDATGQLGDGNSSLINQSLPVAVPGANNIVQIAAGDFHTLALRHDGVVLSWGQDIFGQLGNDVAFSNTEAPVVVASTWLPTITYNAGISIAGAGEPSVDGTIVFTRSQVNQGTVRVSYSVSGDAIEGATYQALPNPRILEIPPGMASASVVIDPIDNFVAADPRTVMLTALSSSGYLSGSPVAGTVTISDNDVEGIIVSSTNTMTPTAFSSFTTNEAAGADHTFTFYVKLNSQPTGNVSIPFSSSNTNEGTVGAASLLFTTSNWNTYQAMTITGTDDFLVDGNIAYTVVIGQASSPDGRYAALNPPDLSAVNKDNDSAGTTIDVSGLGAITEAAGGAHSDTYTIRLTSQPPAGNNVTITLTPNTQVTVSPSSLTFTNANWNVVQVVTVTAVDDAIDEASSHNGVITHSASGGGYGGITISNVIPSITDNDTAGYTITPTSTQAGGRLVTTEATGQGTYTFKLTSQPTGTVTIALTSSDTTEGTVSPASLVFTTANWATAQTVTVTGVSDPTDDGDINYQITSGTPTGPDGNYNAITPAAVPMVNLDDDTAAVVVDTTSVVTSETGGSTGTTGTVSISLQCQPVTNVTVTITNLNTDEHLLSGTVFNFTTANWNTPQILTVTGVNDATTEIPAPTPYNITLTATGSAEYNNKFVLVSLLNQDDDAPGVQVSSTVLTLTEGAGANHTRAVVVRLNTEPVAGPVTITFSSSNLNTATISPSTLTFTDTDWDNSSAGEILSHTISITAVNDDVDQVSDNTGNITGIITTTAADYSPAVAVPSVALTVTDNDNAALVLSSALLLTTESSGSALLGVRLASQPTNPVTVTITGLDATEGTLSSPTLNFTAANWSTVQGINITGVDDLIDDGNITYVLTATASGASSGYVGKTGTVSVLNLDDDAVGIQVLDDTGSSLLTDKLSTTEVGGTATFRMRLTSQPTANVVVNLVSSDSSEGTLSPSSLTFTTANWNDDSIHVVTITGQPDVQDDGDVSFQIITESASSTDPLYAGLNASDVTVVNADDTAITRAGITVTPLTLTVTEATGVNHSATFTVELTSQPSTNVTMFLASADTGEGVVSPAVLTFTSSTWNVAQTVTVTAEDDLIADGPQVFAIITTAASGDTNYNVGDIGVSDVSVTTTSTDDVPLLVVTPSSLITTETSGGDQSKTFSLNLATQPTVPVTVDLDITPGTADGTEGTLSTASLTFTASTWFVPQFVTVTGVNDDLNDGDNNYQVVATAIGGEYDAITTSVSVTNTDDDVPGVAVAPISGLITDETGLTGSFTVRLTSEPLNDVTVTLVSSNTLEGTVSPATLTFTAADWDQSQTVTITGVDDAVADGDIVYSITTAATSVDSDYEAIEVADVNVTNQDDDTTNLNPVAVARTYSTVPNLDITDTLLGSDPEGTPVTFELSTTVLPSQGTLTLDNATTGAFTFVVPADTRGDYTFEFRVQDATGKNSPYVVVTLHITGGDELRPQVLIAPPMAAENGPQTCVVIVDAATKAGATPFTFKVVDKPTGIDVSVQALPALNTFQINYQINVGAEGDHFPFGILIIDHDRPAATLMPAMIQRVTPLGPG